MNRNRSALVFLVVLMLFLPAMSLAAARAAPGGGDTEFVDETGLPVPEENLQKDAAGRVVYFRFGKNVQLFKWRIPGGLPFVPYEIHNIEDMRRFLDEPQFKAWCYHNADYFGNTGQEIISGLNDLLHKGEFKKGLKIAANSAQSFIVNMGTGVTEQAKQKAKAERDATIEYEIKDLTMYIGHGENPEDLDVWVFTFKGFDIVIPEKCGNIGIWMKTRSDEVKVEATNKCNGPWKLTVAEKSRDEKFVVYSINGERKDESGQMCDNFNLEISLPLPPTPPPEKITVPGPPIPCKPCEDPKEREKVLIAGKYWPKPTHAPAVPVHELLDGRHDFWKTKDREIIRLLHEQIITELKKDKDLKWNEKRQEFDRNVQVAEIKYNDCTNQYELDVYWEGWHWKEYVFGVLTGIPIGMVGGYYLHVCEKIVQVTKKMPFYSDPRPMTLRDGSEYVNRTEAHRARDVGLIPPGTAISSSGPEYRSEKATPHAVKDATSVKTSPASMATVRVKPNSDKERRKRLIEEVMAKHDHPQ